MYFHDIYTINYIVQYSEFFCFLCQLTTESMKKMISFICFCLESPTNQFVTVKFRNAVKHTSLRSNLSIKKYLIGSWEGPVQVIRTMFGPFVYYETNAFKEKVDTILQGFQFYGQLAYCLQTSGLKLISTKISAARYYLYFNIV